MTNTITRRGLARAVIGFAFAGLLAGCYDGGRGGPAPVVMKGAGDAGWQGGAPPPSYSPPPMAYNRPPPRSVVPTPIPLHAAAPPPPSSSPSSLSPPSSESRRVVTVERGQSLGAIAAHHHVSERAIIEANHLRPPYKVQTGARLVIPGGEPSPVAQARPQTIPLDRAPPSRSAPAKEPAVVPLDGPPPAAAEAAPAPAPQPPPGERSVAEEARHEAASPPPAAASPPATHPGRFPWPVRGHVVSGYGGAGKNDGINIAAPLGSPIRAIEGGEVAYAGNELKGYGNLILVKHGDGLISAYAHCEELLVKKGEHVSAGQVIAKVGATGGVSQPQLHFELRRGQKPVDPKDFLAASS